MNDDLISRSALLGRLEKVVVTDDTFGMGIAFGVDHARGVITEAPAVDAEEVFKHLHWVKEALEMAKQTVAPVVHGVWENANSRPKTYIRKCSVCGKEAYFCGRGCSYKFCPNCGAKMDGDSA